MNSLNAFRLTVNGMSCRHSLKGCLMKNRRMSFPHKVSCTLENYATSPSVGEFFLRSAPPNLRISEEYFLGYALCGSSQIIFCPCCARYHRISPAVCVEDTGLSLNIQGIFWIVPIYSLPFSSFFILHSSLFSLPSSFFPLPSSLLILPSSLFILP